MINKLLNLTQDDIGGLTSGRPWLLLDGSESWQAVYARLRDDPPTGVLFVAGVTSLKSYLQAWIRSGKPLITIILPSAEMLE